MEGKRAIRNFGVCPSDKFLQIIKHYCFDNAKNYIKCPKNWCWKKAHAITALIIKFARNLSVEPSVLWRSNSGLQKYSTASTYQTKWGLANCKLAVLRWYHRNLDKKSSCQGQVLPQEATGRGDARTNVATTHNLQHISTSEEERR